MNKRTIGKAGENLAVDYLRESGYRLLCRNYWCKSGELDIVAQKGRCIHFIEVKTRADNSYGSPAESVTPQKVRRMRVAAESYLKAVGEVCESGIEFQLDVMEIQINHIKNI